MSERCHSRPGAGENRIGARRVVPDRSPAKTSHLPFVHYRAPFHFILLAARIWQ